MIENTVSEVSFYGLPFPGLARADSGVYQILSKKKFYENKGFKMGDFPIMLKFVRIVHAHLKTLA